MKSSILKGIEAILITNPTNIHYLTGFAGLGDQERAAYVLITPKSTFFFTHSLYLEKAKKLIRKIDHPLLATPANLIEASRENPLSKTILDCLKIGSSHKRNSKQYTLGFEADNLTFHEYKQLKDKLGQTVKLIPTQNRIEKLREIKTVNEIKNISTACRLTDQCFKLIIKLIKPGVSEGELAWKIEAFFKRKGADIAFSPIVAFNARSSQPHYIPSNDQRLMTNSLILLDFGARVHGYCADMTRVVFLGIPTAKQSNVYQTVLSAQNSALNKLTRIVKSTFARGPLANVVRTGKISGSELDQAAREVIQKAGFPPYPHSLGHGVGLDIHETPRLTYKKAAQLLPGMVFSIEPAVYLKGKFGVRIEDLVWLKKDRIEVLTKSPKEMIVL